MSSDIDRRAGRAFVEALWADKEEMIAAVVADGWPEQMVRAGMTMHRRSWDIDAMADAAEEELQAIGSSSRRRAVWPERVNHIWPALPGAGVAPVIYGVMLGTSQGVRASSRGMHFGRFVTARSDVDFIEQNEPWEDADLVVVSGADDTVDAVRRQMAAGGRVVGYGDRVSFAMVVDDEKHSVDLAAVAQKLAADVVMWHQRGCFSVRAILFCGSGERRRRFCTGLAQAIAEREDRWNSTDVGDNELAQRAQSLGMAQMRGEVFCEGLGFVSLEDGPFQGARRAVHSVTVHELNGPELLGEVVDVAPTGIQGVAVAGALDKERDAWFNGLAMTGATRIAEVGTMQSPPGDWWHDGRPNLLNWARVITIG